MVDHMTNLTDRADSADQEITNLADRADSADQEIIRLETDLGQTLTDKINEVEENFKEVVDATLTPAVENLALRMLKLETVCGHTQYEVATFSGDTVQSFG
jgi:CHASE3 domain sensor protein